MRHRTQTIHVLMVSLLLIVGCQANRNKEQFRRMVEAVNTRDLDALDDIIAPNYVRHCQATSDVRVRSLDEFKRFLKTDFAAVPDSVVSMKWMVAEGELLAFLGGGRTQTTPRETGHYAAFTRYRYSMWDMSGREGT